MNAILPVNLGVEQNGSPPPRFDFDPSRTWFRATLPIHPAWGAPAVAAAT